MAWRPPEISRLNGRLTVPAGGERAVAGAWLDAHRETLL
jgi:hypothetical protein